MFDRLVGREGKVQPPQLRNQKTRVFEQLEERQMLSATPTYSETIVGPQAKQATLDRTLESAFEFASDLSQYTPQQLDAASAWVVKTDGSVHAGNFFGQTGLVLGGAHPSLSSTYYAVAGNSSPNQIIANLSNAAGVEYFYPRVPLDITTYTLPDDTLVRDQWHIKNTGQIISQPDEINSYGVWGEDVRVEEAWKTTTGEGVIVGVVDDSLEWAHPDIFPNYLAEYSYDYRGNDPDPSPGVDAFLGSPDIGHGQAVAGIIAAAGDNGQGVTGIAYDAQIAARRLIGDAYPPPIFPYEIQGNDDEKFYGALTSNNDVIDVFNNSWGPGRAGRSVVGTSPGIAQALIDSAFLGRGGLGSVQVFSAGNNGISNGWDNTNHSAITSSPYVISVSGYGENGIAVDYAEGGSNVFVTAPTGNNPPGHGILTVDLTGEAGFNQTGLGDRAGDDPLSDIDYTTQMNGTSASAPAATGVIALMMAAARDNGIELTTRDVQHILALSSRRISPDDPLWQTNFIPLFTDPQLEEGLPVGSIDPNYGGASAVPWTVDPETGEIVSNLDRQFARPTNSAGFYIHDGFDYGYGHGAVDAALAVKIAQSWQTVGTHHITSVMSHNVLFTGPAGAIPAAETIFDGNVTIPGGLGGESGFASHWEQWLEPPDEVPDELPEPEENTRGGNYEFVIPPNMSIESVQVTLNFDVLESAASDKMRMTLISPDGTHSELTNWIAAGEIGPLTLGDSLDFTFGTMRHWGERSEGSGTFNAITGERIEPGNWTLAIENWSGSDAHLQEANFDFHGVMTPTDFFGNGGRIMGSIGVDINEDGAFNHSGIIAEELELESVAFFTGTPISETAIISAMDTDFEPMAQGVMVWVDLNQDGVRDATEPQKLTGADGNFYFDLPWSQYNDGVATPYQVRFETPDGMTNIGPDMFEYIVGPQEFQNVDSVISTHFDANFTLQPEPIYFQGNVFADFDGNAVQDFGETTVEEFRVFVDLNENGKLDYVDVNANLRFDNGIDRPLEPMQITGADGAFNIEVNTSENFKEDPFGTSFFFNDRYLGTEYYTLMLDARDGWAPTGIDVTDAGFAGPVNGQPSAPLAFHRMFVEAGETMADMDFSVAPDSGSISGFVYNDINQNGTRQANEGGLAGFTVYLDLDESGDLSESDVSIITGPNGNYLFENLAAGVYDIRVIPAAGFDDPGDQISPIQGFHNNRFLSSGQTLGNGLVDFGFFDPTAIATAERDYGDLDAPFSTTAAAGGASHGVVPGYHLGAGVSGDADGQPDAGAAADTFDDGVVFLDPIVAGQTVRVDVTASTNVLFLQGWIDFDNNGEFSGEEEHIAFRNAAGVPLPFSKQARLDAGLNELSFVVPDSVMGSSIAARFRYGEGGAAQFNKPNGAAGLGEVEDYLLPATISTSFIEPIAGDFDGSNVVDGGDYLVWKQTLGSNLDLRADANANGVVDMGDFAMWRDNLGAVASASLNFAPGAALTTASEEQPSSLGFVTVAGGDLASYQLGGSQSESSTLFGDSPATPSASAIDLALDAVYAEEEEELEEFEVAASSGDSDAQALALALEDELEAV